jgi:YHS domain-containing protein
LASPVSGKGLGPGKIMKMKQRIVAAVAVSLLAGAAFAGQGKDMAGMPGMSKGSMKTPATKAAAPLVCPVTGTKIASAAKAYNKEAYKGKTYYFCCPECKPRFDKNRDAIIKNAAHGKYEKM